MVYTHIIVIYCISKDSDAQQGTINVDIPDDQPVLDVIAYWADSVVPDRSGSWGHSTDFFSILS